MFEDGSKITFKTSKVKNFIFEDHFWVTFSLFLTQLIVVLTWVFAKYHIREIIAGFPYILLGSIIWTMLEYYFHRFLLHTSGPLPDFTLGAHLIHHSFPNLKKKVALSYFLMSIRLFPIVYLLRFVSSDLPIALGLIGFTLAVISYDGIHYYCHFGPETSIGWLKNLRIHHLKHHYRNQNVNFGVTNTFWDKIFGTFDGRVK